MIIFEIKLTTIVRVVRIQIRWEIEIETIVVF